jgi:hypothetical protein
MAKDGTKECRQVLSANVRVDDIKDELTNSLDDYIEWKRRKWVPEAKLERGNTRENRENKGNSPTDHGSNDPGVEKKSGSQVEDLPEVWLLKYLLRVVLVRVLWVPDEVEETWSNGLPN